MTSIPGARVTIADRDGRVTTPWFRYFGDVTTTVVTFSDSTVTRELEGFTPAVSSALAQRVKDDRVLAILDDMTPAEVSELRKRLRNLEIQTAMGL